MDRQVLDSIQKFENKKEFFEVKIQTRQSFREDQEALERRLSKYRQVNVNGKVKEGDTRNANATNSALRSNGVEHSKLESIVMDIEKEVEQERVRTLSSAESDKEDSEINIPDDVVQVEDVKDDKAVNESANTNDTQVQRNGISENDDETKVSSKTVESVKTNGHTVVNGDVPTNETSTHVSAPVADSNKTNGHASLPSESANVPRTLQNGHAKRSITPEPRLKLRGTRLYEKNSKLTASSSDHLDKISLKGGHNRVGHVHTAGSQIRKPAEQQQTLVPIVAGLQVTSLPSDGNLKGFSVEEMVTVFRMLRLPETLIYRLATSKIDGKRFAMFSDKDLETLGLRNPVIRYFRDRSSSRTRIKKNVFML